MVLVKQWRVCAKHPEGCDVLIPIALEQETVTVGRLYGVVTFYGDVSGYVQHTIPIETFRQACKGQGCCCSTGIFS